MKRKSHKQRNRPSPSKVTDENSVLKNEPPPTFASPVYDSRVISTLEYLKKHEPENFVKLISYPENFLSAGTGPKILVPFTAEELNARTDIPYNITEPIGLLKPELINEVYEVFTSNQLTSTSFENFKPRFLGGTSMTRRIIFLQNKNRLTYIFKYLIGKLLPSMEKGYLRIISLHFCDANLSDYDRDKLNKNHNKGIKNADVQKELEKYFYSVIRKVGVR